MVLLISNHKMNKMGFQFDNSEIKINTIIEFVFSNSFLLSLSYYLFFVFIFFFFIKTIFSLTFIALINRHSPWNKEKVLLFMEVYLKRNINVYEKHRFKNKFTKNILESIIEISKNISGFLDTLENIISTLLCTYIAYDIMEHPLEVHYPYLDSFLLWSNIIIILFGLILSYILSKTAYIEDFINVNVDNGNNPQQ